MSAASAWRSKPIATFGLLLLSQAIFWVGLAAAERAARPASLDAPPFVSVYVPADDARGDGPAAKSRVPLHPEPAYVLSQDLPSKTAVFEHLFRVDREAGALALYLGWTRRVMDVQVNGHPLTASPPADLWGILGGFEPVIYRIPQEYLVAGDNRLAVTVGGGVRKVLPVFYIGDADMLAHAHGWGQAFSIDLVIAATGVLLFVLLLTLAIDWPPPERHRVRALSVLLGAWALRNLTVLDMDAWIPNPWRLLFHFTVTFAFLCAFLVFANGWTHRSRRGYKVAAGVFAVCVAVSLIALRQGALALFHTAFFLETTLTFVAGAAAAWMLLRHHTRRHDQHSAELVLFLICITVVVVDAIDDRFQIAIPFAPDLALTFYAAPMCGLLLALGTIASLAAQSTRARRAAMTLNETLERRLAEREAEIEASYARQAEYEKLRTVADERQRFVRDMHDGIGGQLVSMLMRARNDKLAREDIAGELQRTLEDLRLVVHAMNNVGDNLGTALGTFRTRIAPQLRAAGIELEFDMHIDDTAPSFGPHAVLQIYRILQEACTNAIRHAGADRLRIHARVSTADGECRIQVVDNGAADGAADGAHAGEGIGNMMSRAAALGGRLSVSSGEHGVGTAVVLVLPLREQRNASTDADESAGDVTGRSSTARVP